MPYPEEMVAPMRAELTSIGVEELKTATAVESAMADKSGTALYFINSVCGCAAGSARPGLAMALQGDAKPDHVYTVFAGQDADATAEVRKSILGFPPSSPSAALFKDGQLVSMIERHQIQGNSAEQVAGMFSQVFGLAASE
jgi:putative YphP/YqiW family bacilliredoxin